MSLLLSGNREEGVRWIARASGQPEGLPEKEQILSEALQSAFGGPQSPKAPELLEELAERYPHDPECLFWQAEVRSSNGGNRFEAIRILHQAVDQDPNDALSVTALARHLKEMGLERDADAILADFQRRTAHSSSVLPAPGEAAPRP